MAATYTNSDGNYNGSDAILTGGQVVQYLPSVGGEKDVTDYFKLFEYKWLAGSATMFEIGATLREARERRQLTYEQVEAEIKIRAKYLRALEEEATPALVSIS